MKARTRLPTELQLQMDLHRVCRDNPRVCLTSTQEHMQRQMRRCTPSKTSYALDIPGLLTEQTWTRVHL